MPLIHDPKHRSPRASSASGRANGSPPQAPASHPFVAAYRLKFQIDEPAMVRLHVTADERYELFVDGQRIGRGSERGDTEHWRGLKPTTSTSMPASMSWSPASGRWVRRRPMRR